MSQWGKSNKTFSNIGAKNFGPVTELKDAASVKGANKALKLTGAKLFKIKDTAEAAGALGDHSGKLYAAFYAEDKSIYGVVLKGTSATSANALAVYQWGKKLKLDRQKSSDSKQDDTASVSLSNQARPVPKREKSLPVDLISEMSSGATDVMDGIYGAEFQDIREEKNRRDNQILEAANQQALQDSKSDDSKSDDSEEFDMDAALDDAFSDIIVTDTNLDDSKSDDESLYSAASSDTDEDDGFYPPESNPTIEQLNERLHSLAEQLVPLSESRPKAERSKNIRLFKAAARKLLHDAWKDNTQSMLDEVRGILRSNTLILEGTSLASLDTFRGNDSTKPDLERYERVKERIREIASKMGMSNDAVMAEFVRDAHTIFKNGNTPYDAFYGQLGRILQDRNVVPAAPIARPMEEAYMTLLKQRIKYVGDHLFSGYSEAAFFKLIFPRLTQEFKNNYREMIIQVERSTTADPMDFENPLTLNDKTNIFTNLPAPQPEQRKKVAV